MARIINYSTLVSACRDVMEDEGDEYKSYIPTAIGLAEERLNRELDGEAFVTTIFVSISAKFIIPIPANLKTMKELAVFTVASTLHREHFPVIKVPSVFAHDYWPYGNTSVGLPKYYHGPDTQNNYYVAPAASAGASYFRLLYEKKIANLSTTASTNEFTTYCPDILFYATMIQMARFSRNPNMESMFEKDYQQAIQGFNNQARRFRRDDNSSPDNAEPTLNTLIKGDN